MAEAIRQDGEPVAPCHQSRRGYPVGFSLRYWDAVSALAGDEWAKALIQSHRDNLLLIKTDDPGILLDIDLPTDLTAFNPASR